ncbi:MAG: DNA repair protein RadC [Candidatus Eisenbacteria bacterium]|nr:DNA repair protein RadC [Candidatus Eisenbacteria bacterium]
MGKEKAGREDLRERLLERGPSFLRDSELLTIIVGSGSRRTSAREIALSLIGPNGIRELPSFSSSQLIRKRGLGPALAARILASVELGRRLFQDQKESTATLNTPEDVFKATAELKVHKKEHFVALYLNARNQLLRKEIVSIGSLNASIVHPREVFEPAVSNSALSVILVHNHPSGDSEPSVEDIAITKRLIRAGEIMGIDVLDHVIIGNGGFVSLRERGVFES